MTGQGQASTSRAPEAAEHVHRIIEAAEAQATAIRDEAEQEARILRRGTEAEALEYFDSARTKADALVGERQRRLDEISGEIMDRADAVLHRLEGVETIRRQFDDLLRSLGQAAGRISTEFPAAGQVPEQPQAPEQPSADPAVEATERAPEPQTARS